MLQNYFKVALRQLARNKIYLLINTAGMGIAMACCITSYLLIAYNIEFDNYFEKEDIANTVKVIHHYRTSEGEKDKELMSPMALGPIAKEEITGIEEYTRFFNEGVIMSYEDKAFHENVRFADASFFRMFDLKLSQGSQKSFDDRQSIILNPALAKKYFGDDDPVGKTISMKLNGKTFQLTVGGVLEKIPLNTSFNIDALLRVETFLTAFDIKGDDLEIQNESTVLLKLADISQRHSIGKQLDKYVRLRNETAKEYKSLSYELVPFLQPVINGEVSESDLRLPIPTIALAIFGTLGLLILLIACFNLTNTTLALAGKRNKEIGVRKVVGSSKMQIAFQFLLEMILTISLAIVAGVLIAQIIVPQFALMWQLQYGLEDLSGTNLIISLVILLFISAMLAGIYPAVSGSRLSPVTLFKGGAASSGSNWLTRFLLVGQFSLSVMVLLAGVIFIQNAAYQDHLSLGYDRSKILTVAVEDEHQFTRLRDVLLTNRKIEKLSGAENHIGPYTSRHQSVIVEADTIGTDLYFVGAHYFETVGLTLVSGRDFIEGKADEESGIIVDQHFVKNHLLKNVLGSQIIYDDQPYRVLGVVSNHVSGLKKKSDGDHVYFLRTAEKYNVMVVRADGENLLPVQKSIENEWKKLFPGTPFQSELQNDIVFNEANGYNINLKRIFLFLTVLGCLLSISGIYALTSLNVQRKRKEIGVRKVLGASVNKIILLLNKEFVLILSCAGLLGGAGGYVLTSALMDSLYVQHISVGVGIVMMCGVLIFAIGIATTSMTIFRAAIANPTETLRSE